MKQINPDYVRTLKQMILNGPYFSLLNMELNTLEAGRSTFVIEIEEKHIQSFGFVHGGVFSSVIDAAAFWAVFSEVEDEMGMTTIEMKLNYLAPAKEGRLVAQGRSIKRGKTLALGEATVTDVHGKLLAHGTATFMLLPGFLPDSQEPLPPKFIR